MPAAAGDTIFALSSGALPAAIAVMRVSGPGARDAVAVLAGRVPPPRRATLAALRDAAGELLDRALLLWLPGPATATGEDLAELHLHGGRGTVAAVSRRLAELPGLRPAVPGEFTRRALERGRIDLAQAEGLADLLAAESDGQRRAALRVAEGGLGRLVAGWRERLLALSAGVEASIEFLEEHEDVAAAAPLVGTDAAALLAEMQAALAEPPAERLRDGVRIVIGGPVNAGKSSLLNALCGREAAIATPIAGTTRDVIEVPVIIGDLPCILIDVAGLRETDDVVEQAGIERAREVMATADLLLWLGPPEDCPAVQPRILVHAQADRPDRGRPPAGADVAVSVVDRRGLAQLRERIGAATGALVPAPSGVALASRHRALVREAADDINAALHVGDDLLVAEHLRRASEALARVAGGRGTEDMLDALFGRFCIGK